MKELEGGGGLSDRTTSGGTFFAASLIKAVYIAFILNLVLNREAIPITNSCVFVLQACCDCEALLQ